MANPSPPASPAPTAPGSTEARAFVLLDDASGQAGAEARLYTNPTEIIVARHAQDVPAALTRAEALLRQGCWLAGSIAYEAGLVLEPRLAARAAPRTGADGPLVWFGVFAGYTAMAARDVPGWLAARADPGVPATLGPLEPRISPGAYAQDFAAVHQAITAGDIYQANVTLPLVGGWQGDPLALYAALRARGGGAHGGIVFDGSHWLLSLSPELFVAVDGHDMTARPMKGTRPRPSDVVMEAAADIAAAADLATSAKDRAENLMILDLMRNDLARVAEAGSVRVEAPFAIETYPTVHQMVSTVRARLLPGLGPVDVLRALFPCGSVTGAPKIRAMEWIDAVERDPRGAYCGAIGVMDPPRAGFGAQDRQPTGGARFNVAIRTLRLTPGEGGVARNIGGRAVLGVGSAVVADSEALSEWRECLVKGGFVHQPAGANSAGEGKAGGAVPAAVAGFDLIETMRFTPEDGIPLLERHLARLTASANALRFAFDRHAVRNAIQALCFEAEAPSKLRLLLARSGATSLEVAPLPAARDADGPLVCAVLPLPVDAGDWRLAHKTSDRGFYEAGLAAGRAAGAGETLFIRDDGLLTEGCFTNLFVERDGVLLTPPARLGLLPGVLRASLLDGEFAGRVAREAVLDLGDIEAAALAGRLFVGNALRGLMRARLLA